MATQAAEKISYQEQNARAAAGRGVLQDAGCVYNSNLDVYKIPTSSENPLAGWSFSSPSYIHSASAPAGSVVAYPPKSSMWSTNAKTRYASAAEALAASAK